MVVRMTYAADGQRRRGRPPRISRDHIVDAACELGIQNLTMAAVADRLGVTHQSLYGWVQDRDDLIDLVSDRLIRRIEILPPVDPADWRDSLRHFANGLRRLAEGTPGFATAGLGRFRVTPGYIDVNREVVGVLEHVGFEPVMAQRIYNTLNTVLLGWLAREEALWDIPGLVDPDAWEAQIAELRSPSDERFEFLVHAFLAGLPDPPDRVHLATDPELPIDLRSSPGTTDALVHELL